MHLIFTKHAEKRLILRNIAKTQVALTVKDSDYKEQGKHSTTIYYKDFGKRYLKVVTNEISHKIIIITLHWIDAKRITFRKVIKQSP